MEKAWSHDGISLIFLASREPLLWLDDRGSSILHDSEGFISGWSIMSEQAGQLNELPFLDLLQKLSGDWWEPFSNYEGSLLNCSPTARPTVISQ